MGGVLIGSEKDRTCGKVGGNLKGRSERDGPGMVAG